jgi:acetylornithine deacetylase
MKRPKSFVDSDETVELLKQLVRINSVNPSLAPGGPGEAEIAEYVSGFMREIGLEVETEEVKPGRVNVTGTLKGNGGGPTLMLNGHTDTVSIDHMEIEPLNPSVRDGKLYGRGSYDMKCGLAAILASSKAIVESGMRLRGDLVIAGVCDEEYASIGAESLIEKMKVDAAIVTEPTELQIMVAHKGFAWIDVDVSGVAAHGSQPEAGVDAITKMGHVLVRLEELQTRLERKRHRFVGSPSVHASIIQGGHELSTYPDHCRLQIERRTIPGETRSELETEMSSLLSAVKKEDPKFNATHNIFFLRDPMEIPTDALICRVLRKCVSDVIGKKPGFVGGSGWGDTQIFWSRGVPAVNFGPTGAGAHSAVEYVEVESVMTSARILELAAIDFCGKVG